MTRLIAVLIIVSAVSGWPASAWSEEPHWSDRVALTADLRLRYESIEQDAVPDRDRGRYRVRIGLNADVDDDLSLVFSLATGADNPIGRNMTFGDGFASDDFGFERAYVDWKFVENWHLYAGKMKNPILRAGGVGLIYDSDLNPEGIAASFNNDVIFAKLGAFAVDERSTSSDAHLFHAQGGVSFDLSGTGTLKAGIGYFSYTNTKGNSPFFFGSARGNTVDAGNHYVFDYRNSELFTEFNTRLGRWPLQVYAHYTVNHEVSREDSAFALGAQLGSADRPGDAEFAWTYQDVEADSVIAAFNDSDFGGGGTNAKGHIFKAKYLLRDRISLAGALLLNKIGGLPGDQRDYRRLQLDIEFMFD